MKTVTFENRQYRVFEITCFDSTFEIFFVPRQYREGELAVQIFDIDEVEEFEPFAVATVNLDCYTGFHDQDEKQFAFLDTNNNCEELIELIEKNGLASNTGTVRQSGYCTYPLYKWDISKFYADTEIPLQEVQYSLGLLYFSKEDNSICGDMGYDLDDAREMEADSPEEIKIQIQTILKEKYPNFFTEEMADVMYIKKNGAKDEAIDNRYFISSLDKDYKQAIKTALEESSGHNITIEIV